LWAIKHETSKVLNHAKLKRKRMRASRTSVMKAWTTTSVFLLEQLEVKVAARFFNLFQLPLRSYVAAAHELEVGQRRLLPLHVLNGGVRTHSPQVGMSRLTMRVPQVRDDAAPLSPEGAVHG
jgi:hypothetical protein